jgi:hypothetical protein
VACEHDVRGTAGAMQGAGGTVSQLIQLYTVRDAARVKGEHSLILSNRGVALADLLE